MGQLPEAKKGGEFAVPLPAELLKLNKTTLRILRGER